MDRTVRRYTHHTRGSGVCCTRIDISLNGDVIERVEFVDGCDGNSKALAAMVRGRKVQEVIDLLRGIGCEGKDTSCPDQLAKALAAAMNKRPNV